MMRKKVCWPKGELSMIIKFNEDGFIAEFPQQQLNIHPSEAQKGFRPYQLLLSSVAGCSAIILRQILDKMRLPYEDFDITAEAKRNPQRANRVESIHLHFVIRGKNLQEKKVERALKLTRENCPIVQSVQDSITITESYELVDSVQ